MKKARAANVVVALEHVPIRWNAPCVRAYQPVSVILRCPRITRRASCNLRQYARASKDDGPAAFSRAASPGPSPFEARPAEESRASTSG
jgi:hypothetical protein